MYDRGAEMYMEGYVDGADAVFFVLSEYLSEDIINHIKEKRLEYYKLWKKEYDVKLSDGGIDAKS